MRFTLPALCLLAALPSAFACQEVIDLGERPVLAPQGEDDGLVCGLPPSKNPACQECMSSSCCAELEACSADETCADITTHCMNRCWDANCVAECLLSIPNNPVVTTLSTCGAGCAPHCLLDRMTDCYRLAEECCQYISDPGLREGCIDVALMGDAGECRALRAAAETPVPPLCVPPAN